MNNEEKSKSANSKSSDKLKREREEPKCGRCYAHGIYSRLRYHKSNCPYQDCKCNICQVYLMGKKVAADKIFFKRARDLEVKKRSKKVSLSLFLKRNL